MDLVSSHRGLDVEHKYLDSTGSAPRAILTSTIPLSEVVTDFFDKLKQRSSGFASFECVNIPNEIRCDGSHPLVMKTQDTSARIFIR